MQQDQSKKKKPGSLGAVRLAGPKPGSSKLVVSVASKSRAPTKTTSETDPVSGSEGRQEATKNDSVPQAAPKKATPTKQQGLKAKIEKFKPIVPPPKPSVVEKKEIGSVPGNYSGKLQPLLFPGASRGVQEIATWQESKPRDPYPHRGVEPSGTTLNHDSTTLNASRDGPKGLSTRAESTSSQVLPSLRQPSVATSAPQDTKWKLHDDFLFFDGIDSPANPSKDEKIGHQLTSVNLLHHTAQPPENNIGPPAPNRKPIGPKQSDLTDSYSAVSAPEHLLLPLSSRPSPVQQSSSAAESKPAQIKDQVSLPASTNPVPQEKPKPRAHVVKSSAVNSKISRGKKLVTSRGSEVTKSSLQNDHSSQVPTSQGPLDELLHGPVGIPKATQLPVKDDAASFFNDIMQDDFDSKLHTLEPLTQEVVPKTSLSDHQKPSLEHGDLPIGFLRESQGPQGARDQQPPEPLKTDILVNGSTTVPEILPDECSPHPGDWFPGISESNNEIQGSSHQLPATESSVFSPGADEGLDTGSKALDVEPTKMDLIGEVEPVVHDYRDEPVSQDNGKEPMLEPAIQDLGLENLVSDFVAQDADLSESSVVPDISVMDFGDQAGISGVPSTSVIQDFGWENPDTEPEVAALAIADAFPSVQHSDSNVLGPEPVHLEAEVKVSELHQILETVHLEAEVKVSETVHLEAEVKVSETVHLEAEVEVSELDQVLESKEHDSNMLVALESNFYSSEPPENLQSHQAESLESSFGSFYPQLLPNETVTRVSPLSSNFTHLDRSKDADESALPANPESAVVSSSFVSAVSHQENGQLLSDSLLVQEAFQLPTGLVGDNIFTNHVSEVHVSGETDSPNVTANGQVISDVRDEKGGHEKCETMIQDNIADSGSQYGYRSLPVADTPLDSSYDFFDQVDKEDALESSPHLPSVPIHGTMESRVQNYVSQDTLPVITGLSGLAPPATSLDSSLNFFDQVGKGDSFASSSYTLTNSTVEPKVENFSKQDTPYFTPELTGLPPAESPLDSSCDFFDRVDNVGPVEASVEDLWTQNSVEPRVQNGFPQDTVPFTPESKEEVAASSFHHTAQDNVSQYGHRLEEPQSTGIVDSQVSYNGLQEIETGGQEVSDVSAIEQQQEVAWQDRYPGWYWDYDAQEWKEDRESVAVVAEEMSAYPVATSEDVDWFGVTQARDTVLENHVVNEETDNRAQLLSEFVNLASSANTYQLPSASVEVIESQASDAGFFDHVDSVPPYPEKEVDSDRHDAAKSWETQGHRVSEVESVGITPAETEDVVYAAHFPVGLEQDSKWTSPDPAPEGLQEITENAKDPAEEQPTLSSGFGFDSQYDQVYPLEQAPPQSAETLSGVQLGFQVDNQERHKVESYVESQGESQDVHQDSLAGNKAGSPGENKEEYWGSDSRVEYTAFPKHDQLDSTEGSKVVSPGYFQVDSQGVESWDLNKVVPPGDSLVESSVGRKLDSEEVYQVNSQGVDSSWTEYKEAPPTDYQIESQNMDYWGQGGQFVDSQAEHQLGAQGVDSRGEYRVEPRAGHLVGSEEVVSWGEYKLDSQAVQQVESAWGEHKGGYETVDSLKTTQEGFHVDDQSILPVDSVGLHQTGYEAEVQAGAPDSFQAEFQVDPQGDPHSAHEEVADQYPGWYWSYETQEWLPVQEEPEQPVADAVDPYLVNTYGVGSQHAESNEATSTVGIEGLQQHLDYGLPLDTSYGSYTDFGASTPLQAPHSSFPSADGKPPCVVVTFAFGGRVIIAKPINQSASHGSERELRVESVVSFMESSVPPTDSLAVAGGPRVYFNQLTRTALPYPLATGSMSSKEVMKWIDERVVRCSEELEPGCTDVEAMVLLWKVLRLACQHYGVLRSRVAGPAISQEESGPHASLAKLLTGSGEEEAMGGRRQPWEKQPALQNVLSAEEQEIQAQNVQSLIVHGRRREAHAAACAAQLWGVALSLARQLGDKTFQETAIAMSTNHFAVGSPLRTFTLLLAGQPSLIFSSKLSTPPAGVPTDPDPVLVAMLNQWKANVALLATNRTAGDDRVLLHFGDCLWRVRGDMLAAHICYLVADHPLELYSITARFCLLGSDHWHQPRTFVSPQAILRAELYEYARQLGNPQQVLQTLQPFKIVYAAMLAEVGRVAESRRYCESVLKAVRTAGGRGPALEACRVAAASLEDRAKMYLQGGGSSVKGILGKAKTALDWGAGWIIGSNGNSAKDLTSSPSANQLSALEAAGGSRSSSHTSIPSLEISHPPLRNIPEQYHQQPTWGTLVPAIQVATPPQVFYTPQASVSPAGMYHTDAIRVPDYSAGQTAGAGNWDLSSFNGNSQDSDNLSHVSAAGGILVSPMTKGLILSTRNEVPPRVELESSSLPGGNHLENILDASYPQEHTEQHVDPPNNLLEASMEPDPVPSTLAHVPIPAPDPVTAPTLNPAPVPTPTPAPTPAPAPVPAPAPRGGRGSFFGFGRRVVEPVPPLTSGKEASASEVVAVPSSTSDTRDAVPESEKSKPETATGGVPPVRSVSEPVFSMQERAEQADVGKSSNGPSQPVIKKADKEKASVSVLSSIFSRALGGWGSIAKRNQAKLGDSNSFYYDEKLKRWVDKNADPAEQPKPLGPPPKLDAIPGPARDPSPTPPVAEPQQAANAAPATGLSPPVGPPAAAPAKRGVRSRYVDTFNKGNVPAGVPSMKPISAPGTMSSSSTVPGVKLFLPPQQSGTVSNAMDPAPVVSESTDVVDFKGPPNSELFLSTGNGNGDYFPSVQQQQRFESVPPLDPMQRRSAGASTLSGSPATVGTDGITKLEDLQEIEL